MTATDGVRHEGLDERKLERTREMFMQLLHTDRESTHFARLYEQVDDMLTSLLQDAARESDAALGGARDGDADPASTAEESGPPALTKDLQM